MNRISSLIAVFLILGLGIGLASSSSAQAPAAETLLIRADRARGGLASGAVWALTIDSDQDGDHRTIDFDVQVKGTNVLARCTNPARQKGETYLFQDRQLWVFRSGLRKPISVSPRQRLSGQAANGDIATTNYSKDYDGQVVQSDVVDGTPTYKLSLKAKRPDTTYDQIVYWISKKDGLGVQAEFLTLEGKPFKRAKMKYQNTISTGGRSEPFISEVVITDVQFPQNQAKLTYTKPKTTVLSDSLFNVNNLSR